MYFEHKLLRQYIINGGWKCYSRVKLIVTALSTNACSLRQCKSKIKERKKRLRMEKWSSLYCPKLCGAEQRLM